MSVYKVKITELFCS